MKSLLLLWTLCAFPSALCMITLYTSVLHIFYLKKSKTARKKITRGFSLRKRIFLCHVRKYRNECVVHKKALNVFLVCCDIYAVLFAALMIACGIAVILECEREMLSILLVKGICTDAPILLYSFCMSKHDKVHGGVTYRWK